MIYYKFLTVDNKGKYSKFDFTEYLPKDGKPGKWLPKIENIEMCESGYHAFELQHILDWINAQLFEVELSGNVVDGDKKTVAQRMRFIRKVDTWNDKTARLFACYCARDVLPIFEKEDPNDNRLRVAIETAERYVNGEADENELGAAWAVAGDAAWSAAWSAERYAAWAAAWAVAGDAARSAAGAAAWAVAWYAAWCAAEWSTAWCAAAWSAERYAACDKYTAHLIEMLGLEDE